MAYKGGAMIKGIKTNNIYLQMGEMWKKYEIIRGQAIEKAIFFSLPFFYSQTTF